MFYQTVCILSLIENTVSFSGYDLSKLAIETALTLNYASLGSQERQHCYNSGHECHSLTQWLCQLLMSLNSRSHLQMSVGTLFILHKLT